MNIRPPVSLKIDRHELLRTVRERLRLPASGTDATDPGAILLEGASWMAEQLSEQLDRYPLGVMRQFVHMLGGSLLPARPAVTVALLLPAGAGVLRSGVDRPSALRLLTPQTEERDLIEFCVMEPELPLRPLELLSSSIWLAGALHQTGHNQADGTGMEAQMLQVGEQQPVDSFGREIVEFTMLSSRPEELLKALHEAIAAFDERNIGWLALSAGRIASDRVVLSARLAPERAFLRSAPGGYAPGGSLVGDWGLLDESTWTPPVSVAPIRALPASLHGISPLPGPAEHTILIPRVPPDTAVVGLLQLPSRPMPPAVIEAIWRTVSRLNGQLGLYRPAVRRTLLEAPQDPLPLWVNGVLQGDLWSRLVAHSPTSFLHVRWPRPEAGSIRLALLSDPATPPGELQAWALVPGATGEVLRHPALRLERLWHILLPDAAGHLQRVDAISVQVQAEDTGLLLAIEGRPTAFWGNPALIANAPAVYDGRAIAIQRALPEAVTLLTEDVLTDESMSGMQSDPFPEEIRRLLGKLPLAYAEIGNLRIVDFQGLPVDAVAGVLTVNAPDSDGTLVPVRPGQELRLGWYRRTDGARGRIEPLALAYAEQPPGVSPGIQAAINPLGASGGADRETEDACIQRLFGPGTDTPILPTDWERSIRQALGPESHGWIIRCWGYAERTLIATTIWPSTIASGRDGMDGDPESAAFLEALRDAGPDVLVVTLGRADRTLNRSELSRAREVVDGLVRQARQRLGTFQRALVTPIWPLRLRLRGAAELPPLPAFRVQASGWLVDTDGRESPCLPTLMLNAAVVAIGEDPL